MNIARVAFRLFALITCAVVSTPWSAEAQTSSGSAAVKASPQFEIGDGKSYAGRWFSRERDLESAIRRVITPMKSGGVNRIEVYTDIEVRRNKETIQRSTEKRVFNAADMSPVSSRIDTDFVDGAAVKSGWREIRYTKEGAKGNAVDPNGGKHLIEKALPAGLVISPLVAFTFLTDNLVVPGSVLAFNAYNEDADAIEEGYIKILKRENISVAGTRYDSWRVEIKTGRITSTAHYTTTVPRVLLRLKDNHQFQELIEILK